jgi:two-component system, NtrC family, sensor kinase
MLLMVVYSRRCSEQTDLPLIQVPSIAWSSLGVAFVLMDHPILIGLPIALASLIGASALWLWRLRKRHTVLSVDLETVAAERRRAVKALRETEVLYHSLVETLPQMILRKDLEGRFTFANQRFCAELGKSLKEILGKTDFDFYPRELAEKYRRDDRRVIESGQVLDVVEQHITPHGDALYVQVMKTPLFGHDGRPIGIQGIFWDVTARIRAEEQLKEQNVTLQELAHSEHQAHEALKNAQSRLVQTEKMASLGQLVAGVAHEINNPLSFVSNNVAVLERDLRDLLGLIELYRQGDSELGHVRPDLTARIVDLDDRIDLDYSLANLPRLIDRTREGLRRIERIVKELRLFARVDEGDWNEVDLNPGIESSINMVKGYARKKGVRIVMDLGAMPPIRCRAARVHQVVVNLLTNAIDACAEDNGVVTVMTKTEPEAMGVRIDIQDNGSGIEDSIRERIFDPFFTTKPLGQGTGLGLSISYGIIQEHGGRIELETKSGEGSCFTIHLPIEPRTTHSEDHLSLIPSLEAHDESSHALAASPGNSAPPQRVPTSPTTSTGERQP